MMILQTAHELLQHAGHLAELTTTFQASYGKGYRINAGSDRDTWVLYRNIQDAQQAIARLLSEDALEHPHALSGQWWDRYDVPDASISQALVGQAGHLIAACAYCEANKATDDCYRSVDATQRAIAGMLHPSILLLASDETVRVTAS